MRLARVVRVPRPAPPGHARQRLGAPPGGGARRLQHHGGHPVAQQQALAPGAERAYRAVGGERPAGVEQRVLVRFDQVTGRDHDPLQVAPADQRRRVGDRAARRHARGGVDPGTPAEAAPCGQVTGERRHRRLVPPLRYGQRVRPAVGGQEQRRLRPPGPVQSGGPGGGVDRVGQLTGERADVRQGGRHRHPAAGGVETAHRRERRGAGEHPGQQRVGAPAEGAERVRAGDPYGLPLSHLRER